MKSNRSTAVRPSKNDQAGEPKRKPQIPPRPKDQRAIAKVFRSATIRQYSVYPDEYDRV